MPTALHPLLAAVCVCAALTLRAQSGTPYGGLSNMDYPYAEVRKTLANMTALDILTEVENVQINARQGNMLATYLFNEGTLYNIEFTKLCSTLRKAQESYDECMGYFLSTGAVPVYFSEDSTEKRVIAVRNGKVYRLTMYKTEKTDIEVSLFCKFVNLAPACDLAWPDELELNNMK